MNFNVKYIHERYFRPRVKLEINFKLLGREAKHRFNVYNIKFSGGYSMGQVERVAKPHRISPRLVDILLAFHLSSCLVNNLCFSRFCKSASGNWISTLKSASIFFARKSLLPFTSIFLYRIWKLTLGLG